MTGHIRVWITSFTVTTEDGNKKTFDGPYIFAFDYKEAKLEADILSQSAVSVNRGVTVEIVVELNEETQLPILH